MVYSAAYLTSGADVQSTAATWAAITNTGYFKISIDGTEYDDVNPDFTGCTTMALVAAAIETAIQTATSSTETCTWENARLVIKSATTDQTSAVSYTSTPTSGTDLSGAGAADWMNMSSGKGTKTLVSASQGYTVSDLLSDCRLELFDDASDTTLDATTFLRYLNDGYRIVLKHAYNVDPNYYLKASETFDLEGDPDVVTVKSTVDSSGLDDMTVSGTYSGLGIKHYIIQIDATGTPDTFKWSDDGGTTYKATGVSVTGSAQTLNNGISVTFGATTGHVNADKWEFLIGGDSQGWFLPSDCDTVERVEYPNPYDSSDFPLTIKLPEVEFDERVPKIGIRWYTKNGYIFFRDVGEDRDDVRVWYRRRVESLIADTDRPDLPKVDYHSILIPYVKSRWFKRENLETSWQEEMAIFNEMLEDMIQDGEPSDEFMELSVKIDDGLGLDYRSDYYIY